MKFRHVFLMGLFCVFMGHIAAGTVLAASDERIVHEKLAALEASSGGRLGVVMLNADGGIVVAYRGAERFPMSSTFKALLTAAILRQSATEPDLLERRVMFAKDDLVPWSPVTEKHVAGGMRVSELCAAAMGYSDNTAANLLLKLLNGPQALTAFARSIGDQSFRLDRWETDLNESLPGDERDTTTPEAMAKSLRFIAFEGLLSAPQRDIFIGWLKGNATGGEAIRAGIPANWVVGDKTGGGGYGTTNDVAILWPSGSKPIVLAVYFTQKTKDAPSRKDVIAAATRLLVEYCQQDKQ